MEEKGGEELPISTLMLEMIVQVNGEKQQKVMLVSVQWLAPANLTLVAPQSFPPMRQVTRRCVAKLEDTRRELRGDLMEDEVLRQ